MAVISLPGYGIRLEWTRHDVLTIASLPGFGLPVSCSTHSPQTPPVPLTIRIRRDDLAKANASLIADDLSHLALKCLAALPCLWYPHLGSAKVSVRSGVNRLKVPFRDNLVVISVQKTDVEAVRKSLEDRGCGHRSRMLQYLYMEVLLPAAICAAASQPETRLSRGRAPLARLLQVRLPEAFYFAYQLLREPTSNELRHCVRDIMLEPQAIAYLRRFELQDGSPLLAGADFTTLDPRIRSMAFPTIAYLVDRAFRGAWERCELTPPTEGGSPWDYLRRYVYGDRRRPLEAILSFAEFRINPGFLEAYMRLWFALLVGPPGSAARAFGLLPPIRR